MRCLAVCQTELVGRLLHAVLSPRVEVEFVVESKVLARRLQDAGATVIAADPKRVDTYVKADLLPTTSVIVEDARQRNLPKVLDAVRDAGGVLVYLLGTLGGEGRSPGRGAAHDLPGADQHHPRRAGRTAVGHRAEPLTHRQKVQQYQRALSDADRVLILTHHDPDPDAIASGLALRTLLRRTKQTAIIGTLQPVSRPENQRMLKLLEIGVDTVTPDQFASFERIALVDVQPHYFGDLLRHVDLVVDHHPETTGWTAMFKDIRSDYGSTSTILTEHLQAVDLDISERTATAMLYAIKSDTLFFNRQANRADLDAFSFLYPLADASLIRKMEGAEITRERLDYVIKAWQQGRMVEHVFCAFLGEPPRDDFIPYVADFYLQLEAVQWTVVSGVVNDQMVVSVRNLGYSRNAGDFVRRWFNDIGSAGGHRTMAKAVVPLEAFQNKFGVHEGSRVNQRMLDLVLDFLHEQTGRK